MAALSSSSGAAAAAATERMTCSYDKASSQRFVVANGSKSYVQQFSHMYSKRALALKAEVTKAARAKWPGVKVMSRIVSAAEEGEGAEIAIVGTAFKEMAKRPDVLDEYRDLFASADAAAEADR